MTTIEVKVCACISGMKNLHVILFYRKAGNMDPGASLISSNTYVYLLSHDKVTKPMISTYSPNMFFVILHSSVVLTRLPTYKLLLKRLWTVQLHRVIISLRSTIFWDIMPCSLLSTDVTEEYIASIFTVEKICWARNQRCHLLPRWFLMFLRNVGRHSTDYTVLYPRRWYSS
jgi:hypothetical protein